MKTSVAHFRIEFLEQPACKVGCYARYVYDSSLDQALETARRAFPMVQTIYWARAFRIRDLTTDSVLISETLSA